MKMQSSPPEAIRSEIGEPDNAHPSKRLLNGRSGGLGLMAFTSVVS